MYFSRVWSVQIQIKNGSFELGLRFPIDFDKRHEATDTVAEIKNEPKIFKDQ